VSATCDPDKNQIPDKHHKSPDKLEVPGNVQPPSSNVISVIVGLNPACSNKRRAGSFAVEVNNITRATLRCRNHSIAASIKARRVDRAPLHRRASPVE
jgi:hypothetical protein